MNSDPAAPTRTRLILGSLHIVVESADLALHQSLQSTYGAFMHGSVAASHAMQVRIDRQPGSAPLDSLFPAEFQAGALRFTSAAYSGYIDPASGKAACTLTTAHALSAVDYFLRACLALLAFEAGGLLLHAAGLLRNGRGYLFFGPSGAGKTTAARVSHAEAGAIVLNDDLVVLLPRADRWWVQATPFTNPSQVPPSGDWCSPLHAIYRLAHSRQVRSEPIVPALALAELLTSCPIVSGDPDRADRLLARLDHLVRAVPVKRLYLRPDASFWVVIDSS
jgi:hypothetical protein